MKNVLGVGTLGRYTSIWIATENPECHVTSIEVGEEHAKLAQENIANAGVSNRVTVLMGPALDILPKLLEEIVALRGNDLARCLSMQIIEQLDVF